MECFYVLLNQISLYLLCPEIVLYNLITLKNFAWNLFADQNKKSN